MSLRAAWSDPRLRAYALLRFTMGVDLLVHGGIRLWHGPGKFVAWMTGQFAGTPLPRVLVKSFAWPLPFLELGLGLLLAFGLFSKDALTLAFLLIAALVFGSSIRQDWPTVGVQLVYALAYFVLLTYVDRDAPSVDRWRAALPDELRNETIRSVRARAGAGSGSCRRTAPSRATWTSRPPSCGTAAADREPSQLRLQ